MVSLADLSSFSSLPCVSVGGVRSSLVRLALSPMVEKRALFAAGRLDPSRALPYDCFVDIVNELVLEILSHSSASVRKWKERLMAELGPNAGLITEMFPSVGQILGHHSPPPPVDASASVHRTNLIFTRFMCGFASKKRPLILFIDDVQWCDATSLRWIQLFTAQSQYILCILSYREDEVDGVDAHPLLACIDAMQLSGTPLTTISLAPLNLSQITDFVHDALNSPPERSATLAALLLTQTGGNPLHLQSVLYDLHENGLLTFRPQGRQESPRGEWTWEDKAVAAHLGGGEGVGDILLRKVRGFTPAVQRVLAIGSCVGMEFSAQVVARTLRLMSQEDGNGGVGDVGMGGVDEAEVRRVLVEPIKAELLLLKLPTADKAEALEPHTAEATRFIDATYAFLHERVHQACCALIEPHIRQRAHLHIARLMYSKVQLASLQSDLAALLSSSAPSPSSPSGAFSSSLSSSSSFLPSHFSSSSPSDLSAYAALFDVVRWYNLGSPQLTSGDERLHVAALNCICATRARHSGAYSSALHFSRSGLAILFPTPPPASSAWHSHYTLALSLHLERADAEFLTHSNLADSFLDEALRHAREGEDEWRISHRVMLRKVSEGEFEAAILIGKRLLEGMKVAFPHIEDSQGRGERRGIAGSTEGKTGDTNTVSSMMSTDSPNINITPSSDTSVTPSSTGSTSSSNLLSSSSTLLPSPASLAESTSVSSIASLHSPDPPSAQSSPTFSFIPTPVSPYSWQQPISPSLLSHLSSKLTSLLTTRRPLSLLKSPPMASTSHMQHAIAWTFARLVTPTYIVDPPLGQLIALLSAFQALEHGLSPAHAHSFSILGATLLTDRKEDMSLGCECGALSLAICDRWPDECDRGRTFVSAGGNVLHWYQPLHLAMEVIEVAYKLCSAQGDYLFVGYALLFVTSIPWYTARPLQQLSEAVVRHRLDNAKTLGNELTGEFLNGVDLVIRSLLRKAKGSTEEGVANGLLSLHDLAFIQRGKASGGFQLALVVYFVMKAQAA